MAIALDATSSGTQTFGVGSCTVAHTCTGANGELLAWIHNTATSSDIVTGVTANGIAMTRKSFSGAALANATLYLYELKNPPTGTHDVVATISNTTAQCNMDNFSYTGVDQTAGVEAVATPYDNGSASSPNSLSVTGSVGALVLDMIAGTTTDAFTLGGGQASIINASNASGGQYAISSKTATTTSTAMSETWGGGSRQLAHIAASVLPVVTNTPPTFPGSISNINGSNGIAITPVDVHAQFSDTDTLQFTASPGGTAWPSGLVIDINTGIISGSSSTTATTTGCKVRATDTASQTVDSNAFNFIIAAAPPRTYASTVYHANGTLALGMALKYALFNAATPALATAILDTGTVTTHASTGAVAFSFPAAGAAGVTAGTVLWLDAAFTDGTVGQVALEGFGGPILTA